jgi:hypothetical protein
MSSNNLILSDQSGNYSVIGFPKGLIIMWYGDKTKIPPGWVACDGKNGTPDLRGQFVRMYSDDLGVFDKGIYTDLSGSQYEAGDKAIFLNDIVTSDSSMSKNRGIQGYKKVGSNIVDDSEKRAIFKHELKNYGGSDVIKPTIDNYPFHDHTIKWNLSDRNDPGRWHNSGVSWKSEKSYPFYTQRASGRSIISTDGNPNFSNAEVKIVEEGQSLDQNNQPPYYVMSYIMKL